MTGAGAARIDLNGDLGEGFGAWRLTDDDGLLEVLSSANVACGFHAGDPSIMRQVCDTATSRGVTIGAQVGYHDLVGFGRRRIEMAAQSLTDDVLYQIGALDGFARAAGSQVRYVKPHGALNNTSVHDELQAGAVIEAVVRYDRTLAVLAQPRSQLGRLARDAGLTTVEEGFPDRGYLADGALTPRDRPGAVLSDPEQVAGRAVEMARDGRTTSSDGSVVRFRPGSLCVHGDTPGAVTTARRVRDRLETAGFRVESFC